MPIRRLALLLALVFPACHRAPRPLLLVSTTSTQDSGLFERLQPAAEKAIGRKITLVAVGSGEALAHAERGDADVVIAHAPAAEEKVVAEGHLVDRAPLMWNRFLVLGPPDDPAKVAATGGDVLDAFRRIRASGALFVSRGDQSGTHLKEKAIWAAAGLPDKDEHVLSTGQGQGETVQVALQRKAYALCDSSTWSKLKTPGMAVLLDPKDGVKPSTVSLVNPYHVMRENPAKHPDTQSEAAKKFIEWLGTDEAKGIISAGGLFITGAPPES